MRRRVTPYCRISLSADMAWFCAVVVNEWAWVARHRVVERRWSSFEGWCFRGCEARVVTASGWGLEVVDIAGAGGHGVINFHVETVA